MKIILLLGPSSAGKSTLCAALVKEHGWHTHGIDQVSEILQAEQRPILLEKLQKLGLIDRLSNCMNEAAITTLGGTGKLELVYGDLSIKHQFNSPDFDKLETILSEAGFKGKELENLTRSLHEVGQAFKNLPKPNVLDRMLEDIFKLPPEASVILDLVPPDDGNIESLLHDFRAKFLEHDPTIEFATVLAFCPPKALSTRIQHRNESAVLSKDKREGVFPFIQLSHLISTAKADGALDEARTLSRMQLLLIALNHLPPGVRERDAKKAKAIFKAGVHEYRELMRQFKLSDTSNVIVSPKEDLGAHAVIDLSQDASPSDFARELITKTKDAPPLAIISRSKM